MTNIIGRRQFHGEYNGSRRSMIQYQRRDFIGEQRRMTGGLLIPHAPRRNCIPLFLSKS